MKYNFKEYLVHEEQTLAKALVLLNDNKFKALVVNNDSNNFVGSLTDGDIRRALVNGFSLESPVKEICNKQGKFFDGKSDKKNYDSYMRSHKVSFIPVISDDKIVDIVFLTPDESICRESPVVIMAGGLGSRLGDLTSKCPKPMLEIGDKPILEHILLDLKKAGFKTIYLTVNYLSEVIEDYFRDGSHLGLNITYIKETKRLGTAGSLFFLKDKIKNSFLLMNADIYSKTDFASLIDFHDASNPYITVCTRNYQTQIPFGVIGTKEGRVVSLQEKPILNYEIGAGIYVLSASVLNTFLKEEFLDMPEVINSAMSDNEVVKTFSLQSTWHDIGKIDDYKKVQVIHEREK